MHAIACHTCACVWRVRGTRVDRVDVCGMARDRLVIGLELRERRLQRKKEGSGSGAQRGPARGQVWLTRPARYTDVQ